MNLLKPPGRLKDSFQRSLFLILCVLIFSFTAIKCHAKEQKASRCIDSTVLKTILSDFKMYDVKINGKINKTYTEKDKCNEGAFRKVILSMDFIRQYDASKVPTLFKSQVTSDGPYDYIKKRIKVINLLKRDDPDCNDNALAFVKLDNILTMITDQINICEHVVSYELFYVAYTIIHEAGHARGIAHIECSHGIFESNPGPQCEESIERPSASKDALSFLSLIYANTTEEKLKKQLKQHMITDLVNRFNSPPYGLRRGVILIDKSNLITFYDGNKEYKLGSFTDEIAGATIYRGILLAFLRNGSVMRYEYTQDWQELNEMDKDFRFTAAYKKLPQDHRDEISDIILKDNEICIISFYTLMCGGIGETLKKNGKAGGYMFHSAHRAVDHSSPGYTIVSLDHVVYTVTPSKNSPKDPAKTNNYEVTPRPDLQLHYYNAHNYTEFINGSFIGISEFGEFLFKKDRDEKWIVDKRFGDREFMKVLPYYWSPDLENM